jgi:hypothetical protein
MRAAGAYVQRRAGHSREDAVIADRNIVLADPAAQHRVNVGRVRQDLQVDGC